MILAGNEVSTYPSRCELTVERRTIPGETPESVLAEVEDLLEGLLSEDKTFCGRARITFSRGTLDLPLDDPISRTIRDSFESVLGRQPEIAGMTFWTDAALLADAGIPTVVSGPQGEGDHAAVEWVDLPSVEAFRRIVGGAVDRFCA